LYFHFNSFLNSPRTENDRPSQQRSGEPPSSGAWRPKSHVPDETRENIRSVPSPSANRGRSDDNSSWRIREKQRINRFDYFRINYLFLNN
jgi:hypothetical protein